MMNRRDFIKFLSKAAAVSGIAVATGLPEIKEPETIQSLPGDVWDGVWKPSMVKWDGLGNSWEEDLALARIIRQDSSDVLYVDQAGVVHVGGEFVRS